MKYSGMIGFTVSKQTEPDSDVWIQDVVEKPYYGDILNLSYSRASADKLNDEFTVTNVISIVANRFIFENFHSILYVTWLGKKWKVKTSEIDHPRIKLTLGGLYVG